MCGRFPVPKKGGVPINYSCVKFNSEKCWKVQSPKIHFRQNRVKLKSPGPERVSLSLYYEVRRFYICCVSEHLALLNITLFYMIPLQVYFYPNSIFNIFMNLCTLALRRRSLQILQYFALFLTIKWIIV